MLLWKKNPTLLFTDAALGQSCYKRESLFLNGTGESSSRGFSFTLMRSVYGSANPTSMGPIHTCAAAPKLPRKKRKEKSCMCEWTCPNQLTWTLPCQLPATKSVWARDIEQVIVRASGCVDDVQHGLAAASYCFTAVPKYISYWYQHINSRLPPAHSTLLSLLTPNQIEHFL